MAIKIIMPFWALCQGETPRLANDVVPSRPRVIQMAPLNRILISSPDTRRRCGCKWKGSTLYGQVAGFLMIREIKAEFSFLAACAIHPRNVIASRHGVSTLHLLPAPSPKPSEIPG
jgi:hypothetical protein